MPTNNIITLGVAILNSKGEVDFTPTLEALRRLLNRYELYDKINVILIDRSRGFLNAVEVVFTNKPVLVY
jgi:hypothetical protein